MGMSQPLPVPLNRSELVRVVTPESALEPWLGNYKSAATRAAYHRDTTLWSAWCEQQGVDLLHPLPGHATAWISSMRAQGYAESTLARRLSSVLAFYRWARHEGMTDANPEPFRRPRAHADDVDVLGLTREQFLAVLKHANGKRELAFVSLLGRCGLRVSEALDADIDSIREQSGHRVIRVIGKADKPRTIPLPPGAHRDLSDYLDGRLWGPLFATKSGKRWGRRDAWSAITALGQRAGIPLYPHLLRHTAATLMLDAGEPLDRVQRVLGHSSPETTMRYARARNRLDGSPVYGLDRYLAKD